MLGSARRTKEKDFSCQNFVSETAPFAFGPIDFRKDENSMNVIIRLGPAALVGALSVGVIASRHSARPKAVVSMT